MFAFPSETSEIIITPKLGVRKIGGIPDTINALNQVTSSGSTTIGYDGRGNLTSMGSNLYAYTAENRMASGPAGATLEYDAAGRLSQTSKAGVTTKYQYDGTQLVAEYNGSNVLQRRYMHGSRPDEPVIWYEGSWNGDRRFLTYDERGSVAALSSSTAVTLGVNTYNEYGIPGVNNLGRFSYTGQTWLPDIGMFYYKARTYSPTLGRFMQADPIGYAAGMNLYSYVQGDPVNMVDPLGLDGESSPAICWRCSRYDIASESARVRAHADRRNARHAAIDAGLEQNQEDDGFGIGDAASIGVGCTPAGIYADVYTAIEGEDLFTGDEISGFWRYAGIVPFVSEVRKVKNAVSAARGTTVLGKFPDYIKLANEVGGKRFNIPTDIWNRMSKAEQWAANQKFLDRAIARGDDILLSNPVRNINDVTGAFRQELDYLMSNGFSLSADGARLVR